MSYFVYLLPVWLMLTAINASAMTSEKMPDVEVNIAMNAKEKTNVATVFAFMSALNIEKSASKVAAFIDENMIAHNPEIKGKKGMVGFADYLKEKHPNAKVIKWIHVYAKDDMVVQHYLYSHDGIKIDNKIVDFFRIKNAKIVEYWDVLQPISIK